MVPESPVSLLLLTPGLQRSLVPCTTRMPAAALMQGAGQDGGDGVCLLEALLPVRGAGDAAGPAVSANVFPRLGAGHFPNGDAPGALWGRAAGNGRFASGFSGPRTGRSRAVVLGLQHGPCVLIRSATVLIASSGLREPPQSL